MQEEVRLSQLIEPWLWLKSEFMLLQVIDSRVVCVDIGLTVVGNCAIAKVCSHSLECIGYRAMKCVQTKAGL